MADQIPIRRTSTQGQIVPEFAARAQSDAPTQKSETKYPSETVPLPTKGWFYPEGHPLAKGEIELKQMTAKEEDILANQDLIKKGKVLDKLLESVVLDKSISLNDILIPDKNAIFVSIRRLAYGDEYPVSVTCPQCARQTKAVINLAELSFRSFDFDSVPRGINNFTLRLPSGITITYKLLNQVDESSIEAELSQIKKVTKDGSGELTTRLKYVITSVDNNSDRAVIRKFVDETLTAKDSLALRKHMREHNPDIDMSFDFKCGECPFERRLDIPIGASFLWPDLES